MFVIVPNHVRDAINAKLDAALVDHPEAEADRADIYEAMLAHFNEYGWIPSISIQPKERML